MKELKFRAWDTERHGWVEGLTLILHTSGNLINVPPHIELTQYIGLKDRLGREIYEGDILATPIKWFDPENDLPYKERPEKKYRKVRNMGILLFHNGDHSIDPEDVEIIGTIYENPELLPRRAGE